MSLKSVFIALVFFLSSQFVIAQMSGYCKRGNCQDGFGTYVFKNGARYTGNFQKGLANGKGIFYYTNGNKYIGQWKNQRRHGIGKLYYRNGNLYTGKFEKDNITGDGSMMYKSGARYTGHFTDGRPHGHGTYYFSNGERYEGDFEAGQFEGQGSYFYKDGSYYQGAWHQSERHGIGDYCDQSGHIVSCEWKDDKAVKLLSESLLPQDRSSDNLNDCNEPIQQAELLRDCGKIYCQNGQGQLYYADGSRYIGQFKNGEPAGNGTCYYANGDKYIGEWAYHAPHGRGVMHFRSGMVYAAEWDKGKALRQWKTESRQKPTATQKDNKFDPDIKIYALVVGIAKYQHMPALNYSDDDAYRIYAHLKSPEGGALRDNQIRILIDEDATRKNILNALRNLFAKADKNDVVMLYYSGHGLEGTFIPIDYDGYKNTISHDEITEIFDQSEAKHKICFADACHAGSLMATKGSYSTALLNFYEELDRVQGGTAFLLSSKSKEYSLEDKGLRQGIFSHFLIRGLKGEADTDGNLTITIRELYDYVYRNVRGYTAQVQTPLLAGEFEENMPVGFVRTDQ